MSRVRKLGNVGWLAAVLGLGAAVRFASISKSSIWHDEGYTAMISPMSPLEIVARTARDVHPPLYYLALHYWMMLFGTSELALRSLSAVCMLGVVVVVFLIVRELFGEQPARIAALFVSLAPFLVRYSQEARMYAMVAFLLTLATYLLIRARKSGSTIDWVWYGLAIAAALYTHYYAVFMIAAHWLYVATQTDWRRGSTGSSGAGLRDKRWWLANVGALLLFAPWVPVAYAQFRRVQAGFWIGPVGPGTIPSTLSSYMTYGYLNRVVSAHARELLSLGFVALVVATIVYSRKYRGSIFLISVWAFLAPVAVWLLSFKRPIYIDRYFVFASVGFYVLLAVLLFVAWPWEKYARVRLASIVIILASFAIGIYGVYDQANHRMKAVGEAVAEKFRPGDGLIAGELYVFFDFSYYNRTGTTLQLLAPGGVGGYGESSLFYDRADQVVVKNYDSIHPRTGHVWVIGKTGKHDYFTKVPSNWAVLDRVEAGYSVAQEYLVR